jgi:hypothetical protein
VPGIGAEAVVRFSGERPTDEVSVADPPRWVTCRRTAALGLGEEAFDRGSKIDKRAEHVVLQPAPNQPGGKSRG